MKKIFLPAILIPVMLLLGVFAYYFNTRDGATSLAERRSAAASSYLNLTWPLSAAAIFLADDTPVTRAVAERLAERLRDEGGIPQVFIESPGAVFDGVERPYPALFFLLGQYTARNGDEILSVTQIRPQLFRHERQTEMEPAGDYRQNFRIDLPHDPQAVARTVDRALGENLGSGLAYLREEQTRNLLPESVLTRIRKPYSEPVRFGSGPEAPELLFSAATPESDSENWYVAWIGRDESADWHRRSEEAVSRHSAEVSGKVHFLSAGEWYSTPQPARELALFQFRREPENVTDRLIAAFDAEGKLMDYLSALIHVIPAERIAAIADTEGFFEKADLSLRRSILSRHPDPERRLAWARRMWDLREKENWSAADILFTISYLRRAGLDIPHEEEVKLYGAELSVITPEHHAVLLPGRSTRCYFPDAEGKYNVLELTHLTEPGSLEIATATPNTCGSSIEMFLDGMESKRGEFGFLLAIRREADKLIVTVTRNQR